MQFQREVNQIPVVSLSHEEMTEIVQTQLSKFSSSFDFNTLVKSVATYLVKEGIGFKAEPYTTYLPNIDTNAEALIREIVWDHIILRNVTIGGYGRHDWPSLTITERGKIFFASLSNH